MFSTFNEFPDFDQRSPAVESSGSSSPALRGALPIEALYQHVYVVNLDRSPERLASARRRLTDAGFGQNLARFQAVEGNDSAAQALSWGLDPLRSSAGRAGCFMSHARLWALAAYGANVRYGVTVFEDDVMPRGDFHSVIGRYWEMVPNVDEFDVLMLGSQFDRGRFHQGQGSVIAASSICTHGYFVTVAGARKLLSLWKEHQVNDVHDAVDLFMADMVNRRLLTMLCFNGAWIEHPAPEGSLERSSTGLMFQDGGFDSVIQ